MSTHVSTDNAVISATRELTLALLSPAAPGVCASGATFPGSDGPDVGACGRPARQGRRFCERCAACSECGSEDQERGHLIGCLKVEGA